MLTKKYGSTRIERDLFRIAEDEDTTVQEKAEMLRRIKAICDSYLRDGAIMLEEGASLTAPSALDTVLPFL